MAKLVDRAREGGTFVIVAEFFEVSSTGDDPIPITPNAPLTWTLTDGNGVVINERSEEVLTPASAVNIILFGEDLALNGVPERRYVTIEGTYDSLFGDGLPLLDEVSFQIENLVAVPTT